MNKNKKIIGLDVSDRTIEMILAEKKGQKTNIVFSEREVLKKGIVENGKIIDEAELIKIFNNFFSGTRKSFLGECDVRFGIQEDNIYYGRIKTDVKLSAPIEEIIAKKALIIFPELKGNIIILHKLLNDVPSFGKEENNQLKIQLFGIKKEYLKTWENFLKKTGIKKVIFEPIGFANFRALDESKNNDICLLVDLGSKVSTFSVFYYGIPTYSYIFGEGGNIISHEIAEKNKISLEDAEKKKKNVRLDSESENSKIVKKYLKNIESEIKETVNFYKNNFNVAIKKVIIIGGTSKIKNLDIYLNEAIKDAEVELGEKAFNKNGLGIEYAGAYGLATKHFKGKWATLHPEISKNKNDLLVDLNNSRRYFNKIKKWLLSRSLSGKEILLILCLIILVPISVKLTAIYYSGQGLKQKVETKTKYNFNKIVNIDIDSSLQGPGNRLGLVFINTKIESPLDSTKVLEHSQKLANEKKKTGENLCVLPIDFKKKNKLIFPLNIKWLAYERSQAQNELEKRIGSIYELSDFELSNYACERLEKIEDNKYKLFFSASVLSLSEFEEQRSEEPKLGRVINAGNYKINLRQKADIKSKVVDRAVQGQVFIVVGQEGPWVNVKNKESGNTAWILDKFFIKDEVAK